MKDEKRSSLAIMRDVLSQESDALRLLSRSLGKEVQEVVERLHRLPGRIILTGMGKSGHIARKIAASFSSMGAPAYFIHPAEASHGDLGMISADDGIIALSKSGDTRELFDIVTYSRRFGILLIAVCGKGDTRLAQAADITLTLPAVEEACFLGLAPTTSTVMMLGLGDALAVALFEYSGSSSESFGRYHPGGQLGQQFIRVGDIMGTGDDVPVCAADLAMDKVLLIMTRKRFGCVGIIDKKRRLLGVITDGDLRRHMRADFLRQSAGDVMTRDPHSITVHELVATAVRKMSEAEITNLFVTDEHNIVQGIIHIHDCMRVGAR